MLDTMVTYFLLHDKTKSFKNKCQNIFIVLFILLLYTYIFLLFFDDVFRLGQIGGSGGDSSRFVGPVPLLNPQQVTIPPLTHFEEIIRSCIIAPIWESIVWVYAAAKIAKAFNEKKLLFPIMIISSCLFGWTHNAAEGVFLQGVVGFAFFSLYIKNNYSLSSAIFAHAFWNFIVIFIFS